MSTKNSDLEDLLNYISRSQTLLSQLLESVTTSKHATSSSLTDEQIRLNPLNILHDSGKLLKAHVTKLSLMIINKPFGARSITLEMRKSVEECIMGMMGAVDIMSATWRVKDEGKQTREQVKHSLWGQTLLKESRARVARLIREMIVLVQEVQAVTAFEAGQSSSPKEKDKVPARDSLVSTGVVWEACDELIGLESLGVVGLAIQKAQQYHQTLKDAIEELKEWAEEADEDEDDENEDDDDADFSDDEDDFDKMFDTTKKLPKGDSQLRSQLERTTKKLQLIGVLYQAILKRRIKSFKMTFLSDPPTEHDQVNRIHTMDSLLDLLRAIPESVDEVACAFYELDGESANAQLQNAISDATKAISLVKTTWTGEEDEFTTWSAKWKENIGS